MIFNFLSEFKNLSMTVVPLFSLMFLGSSPQRADKRIRSTCARGDLKVLTFQMFLTTTTATHIRNHHTHPLVNNNCAGVIFQQAK